MVRRALTWIAGAAVIAGMVGYAAGRSDFFFWTSVAGCAYLGAGVIFGWIPFRTEELYPQESPDLRRAGDEREEHEDSILPRGWSGPT
jgi:hypothetical protein